MSQIHYRTCHLCETMCGIAVEHDGEKILSIKGDKNDVLSKGHICPKATGLQDIYHDPNRLRRPVKRFGDQWREISWAQAFDEVGRRLAEIQERYGQDAVGSHAGRQVAHSYQSLLMIMPTRQIIGSKNVYTASSVDQLPHNFVYYFMFGHQQLVTVPDIDRTDYMLILGANPAVSNGGMMSTGAGCAKKLQAIQDRGGRVVLIDPRRTETAKYCSEHHFIVPGMDALLLLGLIKVIFAKGLDNPGRLKDSITGWDAIKALVDNFKLEEIAESTRFSVADIERIATEFATAKSAICYGRTGTSMQEFGAMAQWLMQVLNVITGNMDEPGGMMFATNAVDTVGMGGQLAAGSWDSFRSRVSGRPEFSGELSVSHLAEEILTPGEGQIRAMIVTGGNPVLSLPNGKQIDEAFRQLDFMVSVDPYINETSRRADIILPPVSVFERNHYDLFYKIYNVRDYVKFSPALFKPDTDSNTDFDIFREILISLSIYRAKHPLKKAFVKGIGSVVRKFITPERILNLGLRFGPYGAGLNPLKKNLSLKKLGKHPHGIDLGPLKRQLPERLFTEDKKIHLAPQILLDDIPRLRQRWLSGKENPFGEYDLRLISRLQTRTLGWMHNSYRLIKGKDTCTLYIHPDDARERHIEHGDKVQLSSRTGTIEVPVEVTDNMMPGVVCMPHSWGHKLKGTRVPVADLQPGVSMNDVTDETFVDELSGNCVVHGVPVKVTAKAG